jgi:hypothetical protein
MRTMIACLVVSLATVGLSCTASRSDRPEEAKALTAAREQFTGTLRASYSFTWKRGCLCGVKDLGRAAHVTVANGAITSAVYVDTQQPVGPSLRSDLKTIEEVFAMIQQAIDQDYDEVDVVYDSQVGFPWSVDLKQDKNDVEGGDHLSLSNFTWSDGGHSGTPGGSRTGGEGGW